MTDNIQIHLPPKADRSYTIHVRNGILRKLPSFLPHGWRGRDVFIITDSNVAGLYGGTLLKALHAGGFEATMLDFPAGEESKNARVAFALQSHLLETQIRRESLIIALGGGVVGDIAGFVAATVLRGVRFVQIPTTLLAQVDSSVGGKVGIDHPIGKNLIGAFHQPLAVFVDPVVLRTLRTGEFRNGLAEIVKIAAALDSRMFITLERTASRISRDRPRLLAELIAQAIGLKGAVVARDEFEQGLRKALNLGHTIGHAIEASSDFEIPHGAAVAMGMVAESKIAVQLGLLTDRDHRRLVSLLEMLRLPTRMPAIRQQKKFRAALFADKKADASGLKFVLLKGIGSSVVGVDVPFTIVSNVCSVNV